ncbi:hypothetical protein L798_13917 [Zootermopsis nevadensis]|uniref:Uncharacterized protein n=1 Tax=Zootermopsis nevadensis TaxID=136037 RepID=A0A067R0B6_ZOONE|nr:hypothetical protein L798_13917 [Zootermopsis nevadensis]
MLKRIFVLHMIKRIPVGVYASVSPEPSSSMMGTMRLSLDMRLYFVTNAVNRRHRYVSFWNTDINRMYCTEVQNIFY